jgi:PiT family inorganic phosphate transporter
LGFTNSCQRLARRASAVRWGVAQSVVVAWITIPASAAVGALFYRLTTLFQS